MRPPTARRGQSRQGLMLALLAVLVVAIALVAIDLRARSQADAAQDYLLGQLDDTTATTTPEIVHQQLGVEPADSFRRVDPAGNRKELVEVYRWTGIGRDHTIYVYYTVAATELLHAVSRNELLGEAAASR